LYPDRHKSEGDHFRPLFSPALTSNERKTFLKVAYFDTREFAKEQKQTKKIQNNYKKTQTTIKI